MSDRSNTDALSNAEKSRQDVILGGSLKDTTNRQAERAIQEVKPGAKPAWVERYGNISQMVSAGSAVLFGISAAIISIQVAIIQNQNVLTSELARDRDVLNKFVNTLRDDKPKWQSSYSCAKILIAVKRDTPPMMVKCSNETSLLCPSNPRLNYERINCGETDSIKIFEKSKFFFELAERTLIAWRPDIDRLRKELYWRDLSDVCNDPMYELPKTNIYARVRYKQLASFIKDCDYMNKEFDTGPLGPMLPISNADNL